MPKIELEAELLEAHAEIHRHETNANVMQAELGHAHDWLNSLINSKKRLEAEFAAVGQRMDESYNSEYGNEKPGSTLADISRMISSHYKTREYMDSTDPEDA